MYNDLNILTEDYGGHNSDHVLHINEGACPDVVNGADSRDPMCPACQALDHGSETLRQAKRHIVDLVGTVATMRQDLTSLQHRHLELQHRHDELVSDHAWHSPDEHPIPFYHVNLWLKDYTTTYYGYRTVDGKWLMFDSQRFVPVISPVQGWQYPPAVPDHTPLWKAQAASIAAEQIQELTAEVEQLRRQMSSATTMLEAGSGWIPVNERLPKNATEGDEFMVTTAGGWVMAAEFRDGDFQFYNADECFYSANATHWMERPAPAQEVRREAEAEATTATC
jgi:hypothetical protein